MKLLPRSRVDRRLRPRAKEDLDGVTYTYIRIAQKRNGRSSFKIRIIKDSDIPEICRKTKAQIGQGWSLNLLIIWDDEFRREIPYTQPTIKALRRFWYMPDMLFECWKDDRYHAMSFSPQPGNSAWTGFNFYVRTDESTVGTFTHHTTSSTTFGVVCPLYKTGTRFLVNQLEVMRRYATEPLLVPVLILGMTRTNRSRDLTELDKVWGPMQVKMGCDYLNLDTYSPDEDVLVDVKDMPRALTQLANSAVMQRRFLSGVDQLYEYLLKELERTESRRSKQLTEQFRDHIIYQKHAFEQMVLRVEDILEMARNQVQMVYAVLQSRDNETNLRYGADMRVISAVTLVFLPGTFVATMFSTSFWNFDPSTTGPVVSKWIWLYWVLVAVLTVFVLAIWRKFLLLKTSKYRLAEAWQQISYAFRQGRQEALNARLAQSKDDSDDKPADEMRDGSEEGLKKEKKDGQSDKPSDPAVKSDTATTVDPATKTDPAARTPPLRPFPRWKTASKRHWLGRRRTKQEKDVELATGDEPSNATK